MAFISTALDEFRTISVADSSVFITRNGALRGINISNVAVGGQASIYNHGDLFGAVAISDNNGTKTVNIFNTGSITARLNAIVDSVNTGVYNIFNSGVISSNLANIFRQSGDTNINNTGVIAGTSIGSHAIYLGRGANSIVNSGTISCAGGNAALELGALGTSVNRIENTGDILGGTGPSARAIQCYGGADVVMNAGAIVGHVLLGGGADVYDGAAGRIQGTVFGEAGNDTLTGGEQRDRIDGGANADLIEGGAARDLLFGGADNDTLSGDEGDDHLYGGAGADLIDGGDGFDWVRYDEAGGGAVTVNLARPASNTGAAAGDRFTNVEAVMGSSAGDTLIGDRDANRLHGGAGADALFGRGGDDTLHGGDGDDRLNGGAGADRLVGGTGTDTADYADQTGAFRASLADDDLNTAAAAGDRFIDIENLAGGAGNDTLTGDEASNLLTGGNGGDLLDGGAGADTLTGGAGGDRLIGGVGADRFRFVSAPSTGVDLIDDFVVADDTIQLEDSVFTAIASISAATLSIGAAATTTAHRLVYDPSTGLLLYDTNGSTAGGASAIATLDPDLALTFADFQLV